LGAGARITPAGAGIVRPSPEARFSARTAEAPWPDMVRRKPGRETIEKWFDPQFTEHIVDGLRKAGLETDAAST
jgi:hypothetical protein